LISVEDDGEGIPQTERAKIFEAFYQSKHKDKNVQGVGVGLNMTKTLVELLGGSIQVTEPLDGKPGTMFIIQLPKKKEDEKVYKAKLEAEQRKANIVATKAEEKVFKSILLVEDNVEVLDFLVRVLKDEYTLITATNGVEAIERLAEHSIDLVVSDIMMDKMDGLELCRRIKNNIEVSHIPIVLLTAKTDTHTKLESLNLGI